MISQWFSVAEWRRSLDVAVLVLAVVCVALALGAEPLREVGRYERTPIIAGEYWRLFTGHVVHLGWGHVWLNVIALLVLGALFGDVLTRRDWLASGLTAAAAIDIGLLWFAPEVEWYVGLSGVLHGFVAVGALRVLARGEIVGALLAAGLAAKLVFEQTVGAIPFTAESTGGPVIVAAHLYGTVGGLAFEIAHRVLARRSSQL